MGLFLKIIPGEFATASRDKRELEVARELGHKIIIIAKGSKRENNIIKEDGWEIHVRTTRPLNIRKIVGINRLLSIITWAHYASKFKADFISGHNITGLLIGWISTIINLLRKRTILIYDAHELESGRNSNRGLVRERITIYLEKYLIKKSSLSIVVNETIAVELQKQYKLKTIPLVVRNIPSYWQIDDEVCLKRRKELLECLNLRVEQKKFLIMYHGGIAKGRGLENLILATTHFSDVVFLILGKGEDTYVKTLYNLIKQSKIEERVIFHPFVPLNDLWQFIGASDLGMVTIENVCLSYYYSLPNKLLENIQAETPVIGSDFPEISRIINQYKIGLTCNPNEVASIVAGIERIKGERSLYRLYKENIKIAKRELCWENEKKVLLSAYKELTI